MFLVTINYLFDGFDVENPITRVFENENKAKEYADYVCSKTIKEEYTGFDVEIIELQKGD